MSKHCGIYYGSAKFGLNPYYNGKYSMRIANEETTKVQSAS